MLTQAEEKWVVGYIRNTIDRFYSCTVETDLLHADNIYLSDLRKLCVDNYWYIDPVSDGYKTLTFQKDSLRKESCTYEICGLTAQKAVAKNIDRWREPIYKSSPVYIDVHKMPSFADMPQYQEYRIEWYVRPLHALLRTQEEQKEYIPIWQLT